MGCVVVGVPELRTHLKLLVWRPSAPIIFHQMMQTKKNPTGVIRRDKMCGQNHRPCISVLQSSRSQTRCGCRIRSHTGHMLKVSCSFGPRVLFFPACLSRFLVYDVRFFCTASSRPSNSPTGCCLSMAGVPPTRASSRAGVGKLGRSNRDTAGPSIMGESRWKLCQEKRKGYSRACAREAGRAQSVAEVVRVMVAHRAAHRRALAGVDHLDLAQHVHELCRARCRAKGLRAHQAVL